MDMGEKGREADGRKDLKQHREEPTVSDRTAEEKEEIIRQFLHQYRSQLLDCDSVQIVSRKFYYV